ncbi:ABC transporter B family member 9-like [Vigna umbellata]|uniref:ABC transporter B family member 9-like n=1 Tax=Vigna umbellata TaxID=87088 RepID=UPI001F5FB133|nr:ABC transporter B family member 9-like [Vigna umbellata]
MAPDEEHKVKVQEKVPFYKLFTFADSLDRTLMIIGLICAMANGMGQPLMTLIFGKMINAFGSTDPSHTVKEVSKVVLLFVYLAFGAGIASFLQVSCWMVTGERQAARIRCMYLKTILKQDITFFDTETSGEVIARMSGDTILIEDAMGEKVGKFIQLVTSFFGAFIIAFTRGWQLCLVLLACIPCIVIVGGIISVMMEIMSTRGQAAYAEAGSVAEQTVGAIRTVASFTGEKKAIEKYNNKLRIAYITTVEQGLASGFGMGILLLIIFSTYALSMWYGSKLIIDKGYDGGTVFNIIISMNTGAMALGQATPYVNSFAAGQAAAYKMFETIKRKPKIDAYDTNGVVLEDIKGDVELKDVYFRYPARPDVQIFSGFSFYIPSGTTAALVGQSGSGKSTIISLLERFYDPEAGEVLIDGVNLKNFQVRWIREQIGLVGQEPVLFTASIKDNIAYGKEGATDEEITTAITLADAKKFIDKLPQGIDTVVGGHGTQISGGQKQRIAIARAILKNPRILLLDEATNALDDESEHMVQVALEKVITPRTTVVVAHRLTTIRHADIIAVVHQGKIVEKGTHDELIKDADGAYSRLVRLQEGNKGAEEGSRKSEADKSNNNSFNLTRRTSFARSSSRHSLSLGFALPYQFPLHESGVEDKGDVESSDVDNKKHQRVAVNYLVKLNKPEVPVLVLGSIAAAIHGLTLPVFGLLLSSAVNTFFKPPDQLRKDSMFWSFLFVGLGIAGLVAMTLQNYLFAIAGGKLIERIRSMTFNKVVHQEISWFDHPSNSCGAVSARLATDASTVRSLVGDTLSLIVQNIATITTGLVIAFTANWILAFVILAVSPLLLLQGYLQTKFLKGFSADAKVKYEEASQVANDAIGSIRTVASFCAEPKVVDMYMKKCSGPKKQGVRLGLVSGAGLGFSFLALYCTNAFCFYIGSILVQDGKATFGDVFKVFFALTVTAIGVSQSSALAPNTNRAKDSATSIFKILDTKSAIDSSSDDGTTLDPIKGDIELQQVRFCYPTRPDIQIFKDLCLSMPAAKTVALVGESGSGKSTVISLLERFYNPDSGRILLDGVDIKNFRLSWLRQQMVLVGQEPILFNESIRANIVYSKEGGATEEEIVAAAEAANAHKFISSLPHSYDTPVGERGTQLSRGQKQRIAIARAILKDPKILLLDEATSALDAESECVVQEALDKVSVNRTTIMVAHRLATIKGADIIAVLKNGVIAEKGRHDALMKIDDGVYASMVSLHISAS